MSTINFGGLASGLDTEAIIEAVMNAEKIPLAQIQTKKSTVESAQSTVSSISGRLATLKSAALALSTTSGYTAFKTSSSDTAIVASASGAASAGSFDITVQQLAKEQRTYSDAQTSNTTALGQAGSLSLQVGASGTPANIAIAATDSLADIAVKINGSGLRVGASVIYDGTAYKLQVRGLDSGAANSITFGESGTTLGLATPANTVQSAQDARMLVDGMTVTRSTNQVVGVVPGVTLALTKVSASPVTVRVENDASALTGKLTTFVSAYNDAVAASQAAAGWGSFKASNSMLAGDSTLRAVLDKLSRSIGGVVPGTSGRYTTLGSIGLSSNKDGKIALDESKLRLALEADPTGVQKLFVNDAALGSTGAMKGVMTAVDQSATNSNSLLKTKIESLSKQATRLDDDIASYSRRMDLLENQMRSRFTELETVVAKYKSLGNAVSGIPNLSSK